MLLILLGEFLRSVISYLNYIVVQSFIKGIEEYPDYEYIAGYHAWDGQILKKDDSDK